MCRPISKKTNWNTKILGMCYNMRWYPKIFLKYIEWCVDFAKCAFLPVHVIASLYVLGAFAI